jgi:hypothetical protein
MNRTNRFAICVLVAILFASCEAPTTGPLSERAGTPSGYAQAPQDRPGLGTKWGETRTSHIGFAPFRRATHSPIAVAAIYYNDAEGVRAMASAVGWRRSWSVMPPRMASLISIGLRDQNGRFLPGAIVGDRWFVVGEEGRRYSIVVRNQADLRLEIVLSVDGLDVLDGRPASFQKRGYAVEPHHQLVVEGFRQSTEAVAAFRFGPVRESYANEKYHNTLNVGVIGVAVFNEAGTYPWSDREIQKRLEANPFPDRRFATPE